MGKASRTLGQQRPPPGVYRDDPNRDDAASQSSAMSLHEGIDFHEPEEPLPPYTDEPDLNESAANTTETGESYNARLDDGLKVDGQTIWRDDNKGATFTLLSPTLSTDPKELVKYVRSLTSNPPRAFIWVHGEHTETRGDGKDKKKEKKVDFDIKFDVTETIHRPTKYNERGEVISSPGWSSLQLAMDGSKMYRGTLLKVRKKNINADPENFDREHYLEEACHLFCASGSKLKSFTIRHNVYDRNEIFLREKIESAIRSTNYRGHVTIGFHLKPRSTTIQAPHVFNRLRHNKFVYWLCVIFQLWIITWPVLFFMTRRWDVLEVVWPYKRAYPIEGSSGRMRVEYIKYSEKDWVERYRHTIQQGVLSRAVNGTIIQYMPQDEQYHEEERLRMERDRQQREAEPQEGLVGGALALMRGVSNIVRENNNIRGWGFDT